MKRVLRWAFLVLAVALAGVALSADWESTVTAVRETHPGRVVASFGCGVAGLWLSYLAWRAALKSLGTDLPLLPGARVFFVGQLGKYVPGSVWPMLAQADMAKDLGVPRSRTASAFPLTIAVSCVAGAGIAVAAVPRALGDIPGAAALLVLPAIAVGLHPRVITAVQGAVERLIRRQIPIEVPSWGQLLLMGALSAAMWLAFGLHLAILVVGDLVEWPLTVVATGAMALAFVTGILVVFVPAGAGVREVVLVATLGPSIGTASALTAALLSRVLLSIGDLGMAGVFSRIRSGEPTPAEPPPRGGASSDRV